MSTKTTPTGGKNKGSFKSYDNYILYRYHSFRGIYRVATSKNFRGIPLPWANFRFFVIDVGREKSSLSTFSGTEFGASEPYFGAKSLLFLLRINIEQYTNFEGPKLGTHQFDISSSTVTNRN